MGDGSLAFAPQWLKAGHTSLRSGTQGGASTSKEEGAKGLSWRESGSRLGLGAGADREHSEPKASGTTSRRQGGAYTDRPGSGHRGGERGRNSNQSRLLSDRELVEQTSLLKIRPGRTGDNFGGGIKDPYSTPRGTSKNPRKPSHSGPLRGNGSRAQEREFGTPNRPLSGSQHLTSTSALLSPRQELRLASGSAPLTFSPGGSGQWTSRLADTPHEVPRAAPTLAQLADTASALPLPGSNGLQPALSQISPGMPALTGTLPELPQRTTPRMADTIAIAQANAAQELEGSKLEKQRKEQLALRQSKQLVPVLPSSKPKQVLGSLNSLGNTTPSLLKKPALSDGPKPSATVFITTSRSDEAGIGAKRIQKSVGKSAGVDGPSGTLKPLLSRPSRDKDRLSFFSSLKSRASSDMRPDSDGSQLSQDQNASKTSSVELEPAVPGSGPENGKKKEANGCQPPVHPQEIAQELAFMRSLGWDGGDSLDDDTEGGLTEEEIAAFHANHARQKPPTPICIPLKQAISFDKGFASGGAGKGKVKQAMSRSFHSEMEFSDSDAE